MSKKPTSRAGEHSASCGGLLFLKAVPNHPRADLGRDPVAFSNKGRNNTCFRGNPMGGGAPRVFAFFCAGKTHCSTNCPFDFLQHLSTQTNKPTISLSSWTFLAQLSSRGVLSGGSPVALGPNWTCSPPLVCNTCRSTRPKPPVSRSLLQLLEVKDFQWHLGSIPNPKIWLVLK